MIVSDLSTSHQNYLKAIWGLQEWSDEPVTPSDIAERVGLRLSSVSDALRRLTDQGLVEHARYGSVTLTDDGRRYAVAMVRRHRLIETFLVQVLKYGWDEVHDEADSLEHAVSDLMVERIDEFLGFPNRDPHGDPIPRADGSVHRPAAIPLTNIDAGTSVRVERISDLDPQMLTYFADRGIVIDAVLEIRPADPYSDTVDVLVGSDPEVLSLGQVASGAVWVSPLSQ